MLAGLAACPPDSVDAGACVTHEHWLHVCFRIVCGANAQVQGSPMSSFEIGKYKKCGVGRGGVWSGNRKRFPLFWKRSYNIRVCAWSCHVMCMCLPGPSKYNNEVGAENHFGQAQSILTTNSYVWGKRLFRSAPSMLEMEYCV